MRTILTSFALLLALATTAQVTIFEPPTRGFVSWMLAPSWEEGLLSGNGTIGAVVYGKPHDETIILNHALLYLPNRVPQQPIDQASRLAEIRKLLAEGKYTEAAKIPVDQSMIEGYGEQHWTDPFVPFCDMKINMAAGNVSSYQRSVDFETGEAKVQWNQDGALYQRRLFVSRPDSVVVLSITGTAKINCTLALSRHEVAWNQWGYINNAIKGLDIHTADKKFLTYRTEFRQQWKGNPEGFEGTACIYAPGGTISEDGNSLRVSNADEVLVVMAIEPNYHYAQSNVAEMQKHLSSLSTRYSTLLDKHKAIHGELYNRVKLTLGSGNSKNLQSEAFVQKARQQVEPDMIVREFDAARYNILSSTGTNPPNLQGIWSGTWTPPWSSDFTHDGNVEVAVSSLLSGNMPELMKAYIGYHERMMPYYRDNARRLYNCRGIHVPSHTSSHGWDIHYDPTWCLTYWTGGAGWTAGILYDTYRYTGDKEYLSKHIYPFMREAAWFYEDFLTKGDDGKYIFSPSYSPENNPVNGTSQACINATMDVMIAKELLRNCIEAGNIVGENKAQLKKWNDMLALMPDYRINNDGALSEWLWNGLDDNYHHRHVSHLYGFYELVAPEFKHDKALMDAAKQAVEKRMYWRRQENGGEMVFGLAQMGMITANLGDRDKTGEIIDWLSRFYWGPNFCTYHNSGNLFNMDLSGGYPAVIIRALTYSEPGYLSVLQGLPRNWTSGSIEGIRVRGQIVVNKMSWSETGVELLLTSEKDQTIQLRLPQFAKNATLKQLNKTEPLYSVILKKDKPVKLSLTWL
jgi:hypothetical protein